MSKFRSDLQGPKLGCDGPSGSEIGLEWALGVHKQVDMTKNGSKFGFKLKSKKYPQLNLLFGVSRAPRVHNWVQSGSGWPSGPDIHQIFKVSSFLSHVQ